MPTDPTPTPSLLDVIRRYGAMRVNLEVVPNDRNAAAVRELIDVIEARINLDRADSYARGIAEGLRQAAEAVRAQANLPDLVHFDRPSDFRKGVLSCLAALEARNHEGKPNA
ncbi:hypothetical protein GCM10010399_44260 [Dactylosporangium fulvum]|uniref:Uncharacterized protein n=1 Tax=Dactylosporangium fulvum TaxID=53359 RepID=A0ABY5W9X6_9ACTN|nr:hypothetical protein [Dactylosporangium fulvum]UWP85906.1 hypothetical protein Dfulv_17305 [Dactylosporangium fulvum]